MTAQPAEVSELLAALVAIDSVNPTLVPGGAGEATIARYVAGWLEHRGLDVVVREVAPGRPNVIARRPGSGGGRTLVLNAHMDTVGVQGMVRPFAPEVRAGRLHGRGACDTKAGLAAALIAIATPSDGLRGDLVLTAVCDEEHSSIGTAAVAEEVPAAAAIVLEPTGLEICHCHNGFAWLEVDVLGVAAHGSRHDLGTDAILRCAAVLTGLSALSATLLAAPAHPVLGTGSLHAGTISGGQDVASYPERCRIVLERRLVPGETGAQALDEVERVIADARREVPGLRASVRLTTERSPLDGPADAPLVSLVSGSVADLTGRTPGLGGEWGWTDAALFDAAGTPAIVFGPVGGELHAPGEWVDLRSVAVVAEALIRTARAFCG